MTLRALVYAYVFGGITFIPLLIAAAVFYTVYTSVPVGEPNPATAPEGRPRSTSHAKDRGHAEKSDATSEISNGSSSSISSSSTPPLVDDMPKTRRGWLTVRRTYEESSSDGSYVMLVRSFLDARSKDPKRSRPKDMWYAVLKGTVLYLYEDEGMSECEAAIEIAGHDVVIYPEGLLDGELFARRNAICLRPRIPTATTTTTTSSATSTPEKMMPSVTREMKYEDEVVEQLEAEIEASGGSSKKKGKERDKEREKLAEAIKKRKAARDAALASTTPWFLFIRSNIEMEDWYLSLVHASDYPANSPTLSALHAVFQPSDMNHLLMTLDSQPDVVPMRWLNALMARIFFSYYRTRALEDEIIRRLMKKLSKVKRPAFLTDILVTEVSVGNKAPFFSKPMLKELTKEGDAALQVHLQYKGEIRITIAATATINLGARFKSYVVKLTLAAVLRELEGNLLIKVKRPPSSRIWYAFTQTPRMVLDVEPIVSDRQITWSMILNSIEARLIEIIQESVVMPNMDDISFFESSSYKRRGGIWPDASRVDEKAPFISEPSLDSNFASASAPVLDDTAAISRKPKASALKHSRSAEDMKRDSSPTQSPPESVPVSRSSTEGTAAEDTSKPSSRRSSRLSSIISTISTDSGSLLQVPSFDDDEQRGRADLERSGSGRSLSTPRKHRGSRLDSDPSKDGEDSRPRETRRLSGLLRRTPSQQSSLREMSERSSTSSSTSLAMSTASSSKNPESSRLAPTTNSPLTGSFFSTLKSRAGDKQALSNSAREAMRKWGVNWGVGQKKGSGSDDLSDQGSLDPRRRVESESGSSLAQRARASYAEVRAAVAEMRGKDRADEGRRSPILTLDTTGKEKGPMVGETTNGRTSDQFDVPSTVAESPRSRSMSLEATPTPSNNVRAPSLSRTITEKSANNNSGSDKPEANDGTASPIHTQPMQAKTMSIPGIHASHRGEVMSMGYLAPPASPSTDSKAKMQSVYRLWKGPGPAPPGQEGTASSLSSPTSQAQVPGDSADENRDVVPLSLTPSVSSSPPRPPALPPRSASAVVSRATHDPQLVSEPREGVSGMSASEALKVIASKDESKRATLERSPGVTASRPVSMYDVGKEGEGNGEASRPTNPGPPLPPRRTQSHTGAPVA